MIYLVGDEVGLGDERGEDVQHEALHLAGVLVAERKKEKPFVKTLGRSK